MNHGRIPWFRPEELNEAQKHLYERIVGGPRARDMRTNALTDGEGRLEGPFNALLLDPVIGDAVQNVGSALRYESALTPRAREIATLLLSRVHRSEFEWYAHASLGRAAGVSDDEVAAIFEGREAPTFDEQERLVFQLTQILIDRRDLDDAEFANVHAKLGDSALLDLVVLVGFYELLARSLRVWRTPLPEGVESAFE